MMRRGSVFVAAAGCVAAAGFAVNAVPAAAATHHTIVVHPGQSIQGAVDRAAPGDTVLVEPGTYHQTVTVSTDGITLRAAQPDQRNTVLVPPANFPNNDCTQMTGGSAVCVFGRFNDSTGAVGRDVRNDTVIGLVVRNFPGSGVFGYATDGLTVRDVWASNDGDYGVSRFESTRTVFEDNHTSGNAEAGIYVGDSPDADTLVTGNSTWGNGYGIFVRHSHEVQVVGNDAWGNCLGIFVLDDGQLGGVGDVSVVDNRASDNNKACPPSEEAPAQSGGGIALVGAVRTTVVANTVRDNDSGGTVTSGGILVYSAKQITGGSDPIDDVIRDNTARGNVPADVIWDGTGHGNRFPDNRCGTSQPAYICS